MPVAMRSLFTQILIYCSQFSKRLSGTFKVNLAEDFIYAARLNRQSIDHAINRTDRIIAHTLNAEATEGRNFNTDYKHLALRILKTTTTLKIISIF